MQLKIYTQPVCEPVSLQSLKEHLRLDSGSLYDNLTPVQIIPPGSHAVYELMTLDVAPAKAEWAVGNTLTGSLSAKTCVIIEILTTKTYIVSARSGAFTLGENISNGTAAADADQGTAYPTFTGYIPWGAVASKGILTLTDVPHDADTIVIDTKTYTWKTALTPTEGQVLIGGTAAIALDNLKAAINHAGTANTDYKCAAAHTTITATTNTDATQIVVALTTGVAGDLIATTGGGTHGSWGAVTLAGGIDGYADVLGYSAVVILDSGTNVATGTVDAKIQECDTATGTYTDWTGGGFTQVTTANDNAIQKIAYTGSKQYIYGVAYVQNAACEFGMQIAKYSGDTTEDTFLAALITAARQQVEAITRRALISQVWDLFLDEFPAKGFIPLPYGQLQSVTSIIYKESDWASSADDVTMRLTTDYLVDASSEPGRIVLPYGVSWPSASLHPVNPISIRFICGFGSNASDVPSGIRVAIKMLAESLYNDRSATHTQVAGNITENKAVMALLWPFRLWSF